ncbi:hypothetical protein JW796_03890 [Candidatus Dojkabacteria bacterium]|nr:hypothetical protein [Candidatus Dojkabacteria bacterium]
MVLPDKTESASATMYSPDFTFGDIFFSGDSGIATNPIKGRYLNADPIRLTHFIEHILERIDNAYYYDEKNSEDILLTVHTLSLLDLEKIVLDRETSTAMLKTITEVKRSAETLGYEPLSNKELIKALTEGALKTDPSKDNQRNRPFDGRHNTDQLQYVVRLELLESYAKDKRTKELAKNARKKIKDNSLLPHERNRRNVLKKIVFFCITLGATGVGTNLIPSKGDSGSTEQPNEPVTRHPNENTNDPALQTEATTKTLEENRAPTSEFVSQISPEKLSLLSELHTSIQSFAEKLGLSQLPFVRMIAMPDMLYTLISTGENPSRSDDEQIRGLYEIFSNTKIEPENYTEELRTVIPKIARNIDIPVDPSVNILGTRDFLETEFGLIFPLAMLTLPKRLSLNAEKNTFKGESIDLTLQTIRPGYYRSLWHESGHAIEHLGKFPTPFINMYPETFSTESYTKYIATYIEAIKALTFGNEKLGIKGLVNYTPAELFDFNLGENSVFYGSFLDSLTENDKKIRLQIAIQIYEKLIRPNLDQDFHFELDFFSGNLSDFNLDTLLKIPPEYSYQLFGLVEKIHIIGGVCAIKNNTKKDSDSDKTSIDAIANYLRRTVHQFMSIPDLQGSPLCDSTAITDLVYAARYFHEMNIRRDSIHPHIKSYQELLNHIEREVPGSTIIRDS